MVGVSTFHHIPNSKCLFTFEHSVCSFCCSERLVVHGFDLIFTQMRTYWRCWSLILPFMKSHIEHLHTGITHWTTYAICNMHWNTIFEQIEIVAIGRESRSYSKKVKSLETGTIARRRKTECNLFLYRTKTNLYFYDLCKKFGCDTRLIFLLWWLQWRREKKITSSSLGIIADAVVLMKCRHTTNRITINTNAVA